MSPPTNFGRNTRLPCSSRAHTSADTRILSTFLKTDGKSPSIPGLSSSTIVPIRISFSLLNEIGQESQQSEMSFSVQAEDSGIEYSGSSLNGLFAQRKNILRPPFYRDDPRHTALQQDEPCRASIISTTRSHSVITCSITAIATNSSITTSCQWLPQSGQQNRYRSWTCPSSSLPDSSTITACFRSKIDRPWRVIKGGSRQYVEKLVAAHRERIRLNTPVQSIRRIDDRVELRSASGGAEMFDYVFVACHSDQALAMLDGSDACRARGARRHSLPAQRGDSAYR